MQSQKTEFEQQIDRVAADLVSRGLLEEIVVNGQLTWKLTPVGELEAANMGLLGSKQ